MRYFPVDERQHWRCAAATSAVASRTAGNAGPNQTEAHLKIQTCALPADGDMDECFHLPYNSRHWLHCSTAYSVNLYD